MGQMGANGSDYIDTAESFELESSNKQHLIRDMQFLCWAMGTQLSFLPVHGKEEFKLFRDLIL
jgi:hypothetical protein